MRDVHVTDLRSHLPSYLAEVQNGEELRVLSRGKVIARIVPEVDVADAARRRILAARDKARVDDVMTPLDVAWDALRP